MDAHAAVVLPAEVEIDVFGDDEGAAAAATTGAMVRVAVFIGGVDFVGVGFFADKGGGVVAEEGFQREEAAADDHKVGFDDAAESC